MVLVEEPRFRRQRLHEQPAPSFVGVGFGRDSDAREGAAGVGVDDEDRLAGGVEDDGVGGFRADPVGRQKQRA